LRRAAPASREERGFDRDKVLLFVLRFLFTGRIVVLAALA
jgi:hypothetical protein